MIQLSFNNLMRNKGRSFLTTIGIIIGVASIISLVSISEGITNSAATTLGSLQYITLMEKGAVDDTLSHLSIDVINRINRVRGVKASTPQINFFASSFNGKEISASSFSTDFSSIIMVMGIKPEDAKNFENSINWYKADEGRMIFSGEENTIVINKELAKENNLFIGSVVELEDEKFRVVGITDFELSMGFNYQLVIMNIDKARELAGYADDEIGIINVLPDDFTSVDTFITRLKNVFPDLQVFSSQQATELLGSFLGSLTIALWVIGGIAGVVGGIGVMNTMLMSVMERIQEFGVLKAIGWKNIHIILMVTGEAIIISLIGGIAGVILGFLGSYLVQLLSGIPTIISPILIVEVLLFSSFIGLASAVYPAIIASRMSPVEAVTYE
ncbi:hypothetical protein COS83_02745 [archaeon CG07_land_8_20_14_0_80_38_8]|nr:MAG: hypothetical protein COS83_02745 [archaeon CG07_land_8_20_14_0_80_38_8]